MQEYKKEFIEFLVKTSALKFGEFTLKSGRKSPYFINTGCFDDAEKIEKLGYFYASTINENIDSLSIIFGPSYKGIPLALSTAFSLWKDFSINVGYSFDRKEAKDHGDKGVLVGKKPEKGDKIVIVDDVITSGKSIRESFSALKSSGNTENSDVLGIVISVDRMEKGVGEKGALEEIEEEFRVKIYPIITIREIIEYLHGREIGGLIYLDDKKKESMETYLKEYGVEKK